MFRIPGTLAEGADAGWGKPTVFFQHGILDSADCWVMNWPDVAPAFVAARNGFDVWLGNSRGNKYSHSHQTLDVKGDDYWQFDWEDMGMLDIPAEIEYVIRTNGYPKVAYVGHSQGTT
mmetsp:Transcript_4994/g.3622  ORF Transcript_4994/g.3622 Transcript_4994/m.3622 type:complete len:118 (+) Transcript_4994:204-557(+)